MIILYVISAALAWTPPNPQQLAAAKKKLTGVVQTVTQREGTEPPFDNAFHDNHKEGLYVDVVSGEPLFSSQDKYDSGTGWPSFTKPLTKLTERKDTDGDRAEVRSPLADSHLGHVFDDGPPPTHKRYCMNSASLRFIPQDQLAREGYGEYAKQTAVFAGGCFWSMQKAFDGAPGVVDTRAGFSGGRTKDPTYEQVSHGKTGHREAVEVTYDPNKTTYAQLLEVYWRNTDPYDGKGQFCDKGEEYMPAVFYATDEQKQAFEKTRKQDYATKLLPAAAFYPADESHQHYAKKNPVRYEAYRIGCGRDKRLEAIGNGRR